MALDHRLSNPWRVALLHAALMTLAGVFCAVRSVASVAPQAGSEPSESPSPGVEIRGVDQESTFGSSLNVPIDVAEFDVLNHSQETRTLHLLGLDRLVARCPGDRPGCTVGDLWREAHPRSADASPEPMLWLGLSSPRDDATSPHPIDQPVAVPPGTLRLIIGIEPWFPGHIPHGLRGRFRVGDEEVHSIEEAFGREISCLPEEAHRAQIRSSFHALRAGRSGLSPASGRAR